MHFAHFPIELSFSYEFVGALYMFPQYLNPYVCYGLWFIFSLSLDKYKFLNMVSLYMFLYGAMIFVSYLINSFPIPKT